MAKTEKKLKGLPVKGYRPMEQWRVTLVNMNKELEEVFLQIMDHYATDLDVDGRWLSIARTHLEISMMALNRAVFQPERISGTTS
jgi:predicted helicase